MPFGTRLIGYRPDVGTEAFTIRLYPPVDDHDFERLMRDTNETFHPALRAFYRTYNGLHLFNSLGFMGIDTFMNDPGEQPWSIYTANTHHRPKGAPEDAVFFGAYTDDGSSLFMVRESDQVFRCKRRKAKVLTTWASLDDMFEAETERLDREFEKKKRKMSILYLPERT